MKRVISFVRKKNKTLFEQAIELIFIFLPLIFVIRTYLFGLYQVPTGSMETTLLVGERFFADKLTIWFKKPQRGEIISFNDPNFKYSENSFVRLLQNYLWLPFNLTPSNWTKRVIAIPGDEIRGRIEDGKTVVYLKKNGEDEFKKLDEPYLNDNPLVYVYNAGGSSSRGVFYPVSYDLDCSNSDQPFYNVTQAQIDLGAKYAKLAGESSILYPGTPRVYHKGTPYEKNVDIYDVTLGENEYWVMGDNRLGSYDSRGWGKLNGSLIHGRITYRIFSMDSSDDWMILDLIKHPIDFWNRIRWTRCLEFVS